MNTEAYNEYLRKYLRAQELALILECMGQDRADWFVNPTSPFMDLLNSLRTLFPHAPEARRKVLATWAGIKHPSKIPTARLCTLEEDYVRKVVHPTFFKFLREHGLEGDQLRAITAWVMGEIEHPLLRHVSFKQRLEN